MDMLKECGEMKTGGMRKRIVRAAALLCAMALCMAVPSLAASTDQSAGSSSDTGSTSTKVAQANTQPDLTKTCALSVSSSVGATYKVFKVADMKDQGDGSVRFELLSQFQSANVDLMNLGVAAKAESAAVTLDGMVNTNKIQPAASNHVTGGSTAAGVASGLAAGLYLVEGTADAGTNVVMNPVLVSLPTIGSDNNWQYQVTIDATKFSEKHSVTHFKIVKKWAADTEEVRPTQVTVTITNNKTAASRTVTLSKDSGWTYSWDDKEGMTIQDFSVSEQNVPTDYKFALETGTDADGIAVYTITNTYTGVHGQHRNGGGSSSNNGGGAGGSGSSGSGGGTVKTGDTSPIGLLAALMAASMAAIVTVCGMRRKKRS